MKKSQHRAGFFHFFNAAISFSKASTVRANSSRCRSRAEDFMYCFSGMDGVPMKSWLGCLMVPNTPDCAPKRDWSAMCRCPAKPH